MHSGPEILLGVVVATVLDALPRIRAASACVLCLLLPGALGDNYGSSEAVFSPFEFHPGSMLQIGRDDAIGQARHGDSMPMGGAMITMISCLFVVPIVTAIVAFAFVEFRSRSSPVGWSSPDRNAYGGAWLESTLRTPDSLAPAASRQFLGPSSVSFGGSLPQRTRTTSYRRSLESPSAYSLWGGHGFSAVGTVPTLPQGKNASPTMHEVRPNLPGSEAAVEPPRASPLHTAMVVKNPAGVVVRLDGHLTPHAENRRVNILSLKDFNPVLTAHLNEVGSPSSAASVKLFAKAKSTPIAILDTRMAVYAKGSMPPAPEKRCVIVHTIAGDDGEAGPACAHIESARGRCLVHFLSAPGGYGSTERDARTLALIVHTVGLHIDCIVDAQGQIIVKAEGSAAGRPPREDGAMWVRPGTDLALVACIAIGVHKLAVAADS